ncbi:MAG: hypothetical protein JST82_07305 [Bacteroidetes bacterium]|nr:hypothetical protein [Bacteroidota bacterium]
MNKIALVALLLFSQVSYSQSVALGMRTGYSKWYYLNTNDGGTAHEGEEYLASNPGTSWENGLFVRMEYNNWAFMITADYYSNTNTDQGYIVPFDFGSYHYYASDTRKSIDWGISTEYLIVKAKAFSQYLGVNTTIQTFQDAYFEHDIYDDNSVQTRSNKTKNCSLYSGINAYSSYKINKSLSISAAFQANIDPTKVLSGFSPRGNNSKFCARLGLSYSLN